MRPIDIEDELQKRLNANEFNASAIPLPVDFAEHLPFALVTRTGGETYHEAADSHVVSVDVYADTWETATSAASDAVGIIRGLDGASVNGVNFYAVNCNMPYTNPDPMNEYVPRMTFTAIIETSGKD